MGVGEVIQSALGCELGIVTIEMLEVTFCQQGGHGTTESKARMLAILS